MAKITFAVFAILSSSLGCDKNSSPTNTAVEPGLGAGKLTAVLGDRDIGNLTLTSPSPGALHAEWESPSESPVDYRYMFAKNSENYKSWREELLTTTTTSIETSGLEEGTLYKFSVRARYGSDGSGPWKRGTVTISETHQEDGGTDVSIVSRTEDDPLTAQQQVEPMHPDRFCGENQGDLSPDGEHIRLGEDCIYLESVKAVDGPIGNMPYLEGSYGYLKWDIREWIGQAFEIEECINGGGSNCQNRDGYVSASSIPTGSAVLVKTQDGKVIRRRTNGYKELSENHVFLCPPFE